MRNNRLIVFFSIVIVIILVYTLMTFMQREDLGELEDFEQEPQRAYCTYVITGYSAEGGLYKIRDTICVLCNESYPERDICHNRIRFTSASGLVEYEAEITGKENKLCASCTNASGYLKKP